MTRAALLALTLTALSPAQDKPADPHAAHHAGVDVRGDHAMGFDHARTTHHFILEKNGGTIQVTANDPKDADSRDAIRLHLAHVAKMFAAGDFSAPMFIHDVVPPGVETMKKRKGQIRWTYEPVDNGGRVRMRSLDPEAVAAMHEFLRLQIRDHSTGDPLEPPAVH